MNRHPLHWRTLPAHQISDRRAARLQALCSVLVVAFIIAGIIGLAFTAKFLGL